MEITSFSSSKYFGCYIRVTAGTEEKWGEEKILFFRWKQNPLKREQVKNTAAANPGGFFRPRCKVFFLSVFLEPKYEKD